MEKGRVLRQQKRTLSKAKAGSIIPSSVKPESKIKEYGAPKVREISTNYSSKKRTITLGCWNCGCSSGGGTHC